MSPHICKKAQTSPSFCIFGLLIYRQDKTAPSKFIDAGDKVQGGRVRYGVACHMAMSASPVSAKTDHDGEISKSLNAKVNYPKRKSWASLTHSKAGSIKPVGNRLTA